MSNEIVEVDRSSRQFIERLCHQIRQGYGIVPFVGSGMSARSGILMGQEFTSFLAHVFYVVVGGRGWQLRRDGWPKFPTKAEAEEAEVWIRQKFKEICERNGLKPLYDDRQKVTGVAFDEGLQGGESANMAVMLNRPLIPSIIRGSGGWESDQQLKDVNRQFRAQEGFEEPVPFVSKRGYSPSSSDHVIETGIRALHDWRATLEFLSRVRVTSTKALRLQDRDLSVIDSFNVHITRDKQCNLGHKMLAHLCRPLRIRTILTTNFDELIEEAFERIELPVKALEVSIKGALPHPTTVRMQSSVVKLHGGMLETRADYSLDAEPTREDKDRFAEYVVGPLDSDSGRAVPNQEGNPRQRGVPNHLLVVGYSGSDLRCIQMIKHLLDVDRESCIYWICYNHRDLEDLKRLFYEQDYRARVITVVTPRPDLLLYELYQEITLCLPAGGFAHEFTHKVPPEQTSTTQEHTEDLSSLRQALRDGKDLMMLARQKCANRPHKEASARKLARRAIAQQLADFVTRVLYGQASPGRMGDYAFVAAATQVENAGKTLTVNTITGAASAMRLVFDELTRAFRECVWLELQDYSDVSSLLQEMLRIISLRQGTYQLEHVVLNPLQDLPCSYPSVDLNDCNEQAVIDKWAESISSRRAAKGKRKKPKRSKREAERAMVSYKTLVRHLRDLAHYFNIDPSNYVFLLYGRDVPGGCAGWHNNSWNEGSYGQLRTVFHALNAVGFNVIYVPLTKNRCVSEEAKRATIHDCVDIVSAWLPSFAREHNSAYRSHKIPYHDVDKVAAQDAHGAFMAGQEDLDTQLPVKRKAVDTVNLGTNDGITGDLVGASDSLSLYRSILENTLEQWLRPDIGPQINRDGITRERQLFRTRLQFLYATTLFRQSRHTSAFFAEAVYSCPFRFNALGVDNDWERARDVRNWINELRELRIFYYKPGGYCWKYRDVRIGLRQLFEELKIYDLDPGDSESNPRPILDFFGQSRARLHFWIGEWYFKAFTATGHSMPVVECLYHRFMSAQHCVYAKPGRLSYTTEALKIQKYRIVMFQSSVMEMIKTVQIARPWLKFWLGSVSGSSLFADSAAPVRDLTKTSNDLVGELHKIIEQSDDNSTKHADRIGRHHAELIDQLKWHFTSLDHSIKAESGNYHGKLAVPVRYPGLFHANLSESNGAPDGETNSGKRPMILVALDADPSADTTSQSDDDSYRTFDPGKVALEDWLDDWKKPFADLNAHELVWDTIVEHPFDPSVPNDTLKHALNTKKTDWVFEHSYDQAKVYQIVGLLSEFAYLHIIRYKLEFHAKAECRGPSRYGREWYLQARKLLVRSTLLCNLGIDLCKHLYPSFREYELKTKIKLHSIYGLALANLDRFFEAHRHLNESTSLLAKMHNTLEPNELAIIRLRRAETHITEALRLRDVLDEVRELREGEFARWRELEKKIRLDLAQRAGCELQLPPLLHGAITKNECHAAFCSRVYRMHVAALDDAWSALTSAEQLMAGRSHSSLWWGRLATLKLRVYGVHWKHPENEFALETLAFRKREQRDSSLEDLFRKAIMTDPRDELRRIRTVHYYYAACEAVFEPDSAELTRARATALERLPEANTIDPDKTPLIEYRNQVFEFIDHSQAHSGSQAVTYVYSTQAQAIIKTLEMSTEEQVEIDITVKRLTHATPLDHQFEGQTVRRMKGVNFNIDVTVSESQVNIVSVAKKGEEPQTVT